MKFLDQELQTSNPVSVDGVEGAEEEEEGAAAEASAQSSLYTCHCPLRSISSSVFSDVLAT